MTIVLGRRVAHHFPGRGRVEVKRVLLCVSLAAVAVLSIPALAGAAEYDAFVSCDDLSENPAPSHVCQIGDFPGAYFESDEDTEYDVCVEFPTGEELCAEEQFAERASSSSTRSRPNWRAITSFPGTSEKWKSAPGASAWTPRRHHLHHPSCRHRRPRLHRLSFPLNHRWHA